MINTVKTNGISLSYEERGEGEPLILIMGLGAPGSKWEPHIRAYEKHFRVLALDNRGAGFSDKPNLEAYTTAQMADDVIGLMDALNITSAHLHGISMGGAIAQIAAIQHPERVRSLILTSAFARPNVPFRRAIELLRDSCGKVDGSTQNHLTQWIIYSHTFMNQNENFILELEKSDLASTVPPMPTFAYKAQCAACLSHNAFPKLGSIQCPTLVASGDADLFTPVDLTMEMVDHIPGATLYMCTDGGHVHHWEQLEAFNDATLRFLLDHRTGER
ncbi:alpha/beta hydrolase fold protein [Spirochaetia bacterium]|nr:alpha/beta hydrolase fold protein [Spirochaetia bacterium]